MAWVTTILGVAGHFAGFLDPVITWVLGHAGSLFALAGLGSQFGDLPGWVLPVVGVAYATSLVIRLGESALNRFMSGGGG